MKKIMANMEQVSFKANMIMIDDDDADDKTIIIIFVFMHALRNLQLCVIILVWMPICMMEEEMTVLQKKFLLSRCAASIYIR